MYINKKLHTSSRFARLRAVSKLSTFFIHPVEELALQQQKQELQLSGEIAAAEAEQFVYEQAKVEELSQFSHILVKSKNPFAPKTATSNQQRGSSKANAPQVDIVHVFPVLKISMNPAFTPQDKLFR